MFRRILVPVDLTEKSLAAVDIAYEFAVRSAAEVTLLHVIETIEHVPFDELKPFYERLEKSARKQLQDFAERFTAHKLPVAHAVIYGHRSQQIIEYAAANSVDLIVIASHRIDPERPGRDWSSISYVVAMTSTCPVLLVK